MSKPNAVHSAHASYASTEDELDIDDEPVDTGLIRCICNSSEDDGFTIQCERCLVWQHAFCVNISQHNIPEHYLCDQCVKRIRHYAMGVKPSDMDRAVENEERPASRSRTRPDVSTRRRGGPSAGAAPAADDTLKNGLADKHHFRDIHNRMEGLISNDDDEYKPAAAAKRPPSHQRSRSVAGRPPSKKPKLSKRIPVSKKSLQEMEGDSAARQPSQRKMKTASRFQLSNTNTIRSRHVEQIFKDATERGRRMERTREQQQQPPPQRSPVHFVVMNESDIQLSIPKATVRPLAKSLYSLNDTSQPLSGMFADIHIPANRLIAEINGDILLKSEYKFNHDNDFAVLGTPCVHVFFYPTIDLCIDARTRGSLSRSIRRACHPNAELRSIISSTKDNSSEEVRLGIFSRVDIDKGEEITIGWNWQRGHVSWKKNLEWHSMMSTGGIAHQVIDEQEERSSRVAVARMISLFDNEFVDCACHDREICFIEHLRRSNVMMDWQREPPFVPRAKPASSTASRAAATDTHPAQFAPNGVENAALMKRQPGKRTYDQANVEDGQNQLPSRLSVVANANAKPDATDKAFSDAGDDSVIDILSTSPAGGSPVIMPTSSSSRAVTDTEEELDIDGDIDVGEEEYTQQSTEKARDGGDDMGSVSSPMSASASDTVDGQRKTRRTKNESPKLPCKKIWMRSFIRQANNNDSNSVQDNDETKARRRSEDVKSIVTDATPMDLAAAAESTPLSDKNIEEEKEEKAETMHRSSALQGEPATMNEDFVPSMAPKETQQGVDDDLDDGELSDASTASTIPLDQDHDYRMDADLDNDEPVEAEPASSASTKVVAVAAASDHDETVDTAAVHEQLSSPKPAEPLSGQDRAVEGQTLPEKAEQPEQKQVAVDANDSQSADDSNREAKPTKVKLSLQEYLSRRAAGSQGGPSNGSHSSASDMNKEEVKHCGTATSMAGTDISSMEKEQPEAIVNQH